MRRRRIAALMAGLNREYQRDFAQGMVREAQAQGIDLCIFACQGTTDAEDVQDETYEANIFDLPDLHAFDGVAALCATIATQHTRRHLHDLLFRQKGRPQVIVDDDAPQAVHLSFDDNSSVLSLTRHLVRTHGYRRFVLLTGPKGNPVADGRSRAYLEGLRAEGIDLEASNILDGRWMRLGGQEAAEMVLCRGSVPEVFLCCNDDMALGVIDVLERHGLRVPEDVCVTGFDARREAVGRGLTTIRRPVSGAGAKTVQLLCRWIEDEPPESRQICLPTEVVYGDSCGCSLQQNPSRNYVRVLSDERRAMERSMMQTSSFSNALAAVLTEEEAGAVLNRFAERWAMKNFHVCVDPNFLRRSDAALQMGYPERMLLLADHGAKKSGTQQIFPTSQLLPWLEEEREAPAVLVFCPLYCLQRNFGYAVLDVDFATTLALHPLLTLLGNGLMSLHLQSTVRVYASALEELSLHDPLTGLLNRRGYDQEAPLLLKLAREGGRTFVMLSADMDGMKEINDRYGHLAGDDAISCMGKAMCELESLGMTSIHISGDEFLAMGVLSEAVGEEQVLEAFLAAVERANRQKTRPYRIEASVGVHCAVPKEGETVYTFQGIADRRMYAWKRQHKLMKRKQANKKACDFSIDLDEEEQETGGEQRCL